MLLQLKASTIKLSQVRTSDTSGKLEYFKLSLGVANAAALVSQLALSLS